MAGYCADPAICCGWEGGAFMPGAAGAYGAPPPESASVCAADIGDPWGCGPVAAGPGAKAPDTEPEGGPFMPSAMVCATAPLADGGPCIGADVGAGDACSCGAGCWGGNATGEVVGSGVARRTAGAGSE